jgi:UDP-N-acetylglucosamine 2-epimerase (non-hydrolysing)
MNHAPRIAIVIGTRAQFIKTAPVMRVLEQRGIPYRFVFTAQHQETIDSIRGNFGVKPPDYVLSAGRSEAKTIGLFGNWSCRALWALLVHRRAIIPFRGGIVINHGDTATCLWGSLLARLTGNDAMHLESGLRSFHLFKPFPEELIRLLTFALTTVYVAPNPWALNNLRRYRGAKIDTGLNTLYDAVQLALAHDSAAGPPPAGPYAVVSIHRFENIFRPAAFRRIVDQVDRVAASMRLVFVAHPATARQLDRLGLRQRIAANPNITVCDRLPFFDFIRLSANAEFVITDGGSNQEELTYLGKPTLILREATERREGLGETAVLSNLDPVTIDEFVRNYAAHRRPPLTVTQRPSERIADWLVVNGFAEPREAAPGNRRTFWRAVVALLVVALAGVYVWGHRAALLALLQHFRPQYVPGLALVTFLSVAVNGVIMRDLVGQFGVRMRVLEWFGLTAVGSLSNYLPMPQAGAVARGLYLKRVHRLPYDAFTATVLVTYVMVLPAIGGLGLIGLTVMALTSQPTPWPLWLLFALLAASVAVFGPAMGLLRVFRRFAGFHDGLAILLQQHRLGRMVALQVAQLLLTAIAMGLAFRALGNPIGWSGSLMLGLMANASGIANVTPGNLGITESAAALGAYLLRGDPHLAIVAYSVIRVVSVCVLALVGPACLLLSKSRARAVGPQPVQSSPIGADHE